MLFVVVDRAMFGSSAAAVFTSREKAEVFLANVDLQNASIVTQSVVGNYTPGSSVYAAEEYDPGYDIHHFIGLYAQYQAAKDRAGELGHALSLVPDEREEGMADGNHGEQTV